MIASLAPTPQAPIALGRYQLLARVASGGTAEIFVALSAEAQEGSLLAIKRLHPFLAEDALAVDNFAEEARRTSALAHPHVVRIYEHGLDESRVPFIAMEFLPGATLKGVVRYSLMQATMPPIPFSIWVVARACQALHHAHSVGVAGQSIIHGDVSPENILVTYHGIVKLLDFGVVQPPPTDRDQVRTSVRGKLSYMAPEVAFGHPNQAASDQFSMGIVLYELITGQRVYRQHRTLEALREAMQQPLAPPLTLNPQIPAELDRIVSTACALDPTERFPDCHLFQAALEKFLEESGISLTEEDIAQYMQSLFAEEYQGYQAWLQQLPSGSAPSASVLPPPEEPIDRGQAPVLPPPNQPEEHSSGGLSTDALRAPSNQLLLFCGLVGALLFGILGLKLFSGWFAPHAYEARPATTVLVRPELMTGPEQSPTLGSIPVQPGIWASPAALPARAPGVSTQLQPITGASPATGPPTALPDPSATIPSGGPSPGLPSQLANLWQPGPVGSHTTGASMHQTGAALPLLPPEFPAPDHSSGTASAPQDSSLEPVEESGYLRLTTNRSPIVVWEGEQIIGLAPLDQDYPAGSHVFTLRDLRGRVLQTIPLEVPVRSSVSQHVELP